MNNFISICVCFLSLIGLFFVFIFVIDVIRSNRRKYIYGKLDVEPCFLNNKIDELSNLLNEEVEKNNELITENKRLETEKYKLVEELNKYS